MSHPSCIVTFLHPSLCVNDFFSTGLSTTGTWDYFSVTASVLSCPGTAQYTFLSSLVMPFPWTLAPAYAALVLLIALHPLVQLRVGHPSARRGSPAHTCPPLSCPALPDTRVCTMSTGYSHRQLFTHHTSLPSYTHACKHHTKNEMHGALIGPSAFFTQPVSQRLLHWFVQKQCGWEPEAGLAFSSFLPSFLRLTGCDSLNAVVYCFCFHI